MTTTSHPERFDGRTVRALRRVPERPDTARREALIKRAGIEPE